MTFKTSQFGDGVSTTQVRAVHNHYGPWTEVSPDGILLTDGSRNEYSWEITGADLQNAAQADRWLVIPTLPKNAIIEKAVVEVKEVFALGGTTPTINFGTNGSETTNGISITQAQAQALGVFNVTTFNGTWGSALTADTSVNVALGGTSPTVTSAGRVRIVVTATVLKP